MVRNFTLLQRLPAFFLESSIFQGSFPLYTENRVIRVGGKGLQSFHEARLIFYSGGLDIMENIPLILDFQVGT